MKDEVELIWKHERDETIYEANISMAVVYDGFKIGVQIHTHSNSDVEIKYFPLYNDTLFKAKESNKDKIPQPIEDFVKTIAAKEVL